MNSGNNLIGIAMAYRSFFNQERTAHSDCLFPVLGLFGKPDALMFDYFSQ
jgi:hypothetical protein